MWVDSAAAPVGSRTAGVDLDLVDGHRVLVRTVGAGRGQRGDPDEHILRGRPDRYGIGHTGRLRFGNPLVGVEDLLIAGVGRTRVGVAHVGRDDRAADV